MLYVPWKIEVFNQIFEDEPMDGNDQSYYKHKLFDNSNAFTLSYVKHGYQPEESPHGTKIHAAVLMLSPQWNQHDSGRTFFDGYSEAIPDIILFR